MTLRTAVTLDHDVVECGGTVTGTAEWSGNTRRQRVGVVLHHWTQGRGDATGAVACTAQVGGVAAAGRAPFRLKVPPDGPVSHDGRLLRLLWGVTVQVPAAGSTRADPAVRTADLTVVPRGLPRLAPPVPRGYRSRGLPGNPFALGEDPPDFADLVDRDLGPVPVPGRRRLIQVIGVSGAGKSATLRRWHAAAPGPWHHVPPGTGRLRRLPVASLVYWDEANRAPAPLRRDGLRRAARQGATVVAGTHDDLGAQARAAGLAVDTVRLAPICAAELIAWAARRFAAAGATGWSLPPAVAAAVAARAGASWWVAGDLLHAWVAGEVERSGSA